MRALPEGLDILVERRILETRGAVRGNHSDAAAAAIREGIHRLLDQILVVDPDLADAIRG